MNFSKKYLKYVRWNKPQILSITIKNYNNKQCWFPITNVSKIVNSVLKNKCISTVITESHCI